MFLTLHNVVIPKEERIMDTIETLIRKTTIDLEDVDSKRKIRAV